MAKLYEIVQDLRGAEDIEDEGALVKRMDGLQLQLETKVEAICKFLSNLTSEADVLESESKRLSSRAKAVRRQSEWIKAYLKGNLDALKVSKLKTPLYRLSLSDSQPMVEVWNMNDIPKEFVKTTIETVVDKQAILEHFKRTGEVVNGVNITQGKTLRIT